ncbi:MAG: DHA1 family bicyclomycin/chloramphenicol resistance-like MFS transporter [Halopseudomonas sp.]|jgi:DHA1 family bicyclomycin/chloramphenicol resistance-like MFS transporter|uniref:multidrug effflux MFS transporter n=1 Tax=Halopseudomonas sp. TaxID=2901191 RepID=UPI0039E504A6
MPFNILLILGGLSAFGPLAIDLYLPAFPAMAESFGTDIEHIQLSMSVYFLGLASGQIFYGPLADRFGRRKPLMFGIGLFALASLACALAPTLEWLLAARFAQALGGCAGMVVTRAVVRDLCKPIDAAKAFSQLMLVMGVAPILAPLGGGLLLNLGGWPLIFFFLAAFSALFAFAVFFGLRETLTTLQAPAPLSSAFGRYGRLLREPVFMYHALTGGVAIAGMFAYIAGSPFVIMQLYGVPAEHFGWFFGSIAAGFILSAQFNSRMLRRRPPVKLLQRTTLIYLACTLWLLGTALWQPASLWPLLLPLFGSVAVVALVLPNSSACAMAGHGHQAGVASALMGTMQFIIAGITSALVGILHDGTAVPMAAVMAGCGVLVVLMARQARRAGGLGF